ncbi:hypothetical protein [Algoriphagus mannitolivorans]|uniref:hypothetical protein n=1 Tax=Algoriphagus mannitolivorans TaxID=226504 RepID=UPI0004265EE8|nr:hypothetical protein [Algoriphagus mannitolivorans]
MKKFLVLPLLFLFSWVSGQNLDGAWKLISQNGKAVTDQEYIKIYQDNYFAFGVKNVADNAFIGAGGGPYSFENGKYSETLDFFTLNPLQIGTTTPFKVDLSGNKLTLSANTNNGMLVEVWEKISSDEDALSGNWVITGRKREDQISRSTPGARRTIKILSGGRFQWVAFNSETREFSGTGGGTYTAKDGKYTENITFFSRDNSRVGASLGFDFEVIDGEWHHSGLSSTGSPIYEIWTPYAIGYKPAK